MLDRITELQGRVQDARSALEGLAERAARLRERLESGIPRHDTPAPPSGTPPSEPPPATNPETSALASSLERLTQTTWVSVTTTASEGDDGRFVSDAWEIALISEEGK